MVKRRRNPKAREERTRLLLHKPHKESPVLMVPISVTDQGIQNHVFSKSSQYGIMDLRDLKHLLNRADDIRKCVVAMMLLLITVVAGNLPGENLIAVQKVFALFHKHFRSAANPICACGKFYL